MLGEIAKGAAVLLIEAGLSALGFHPAFLILSGLLLLALVYRRHLSAWLWKLPAGTEPNKKSDLGFAERLSARVSCIASDRREGWKLDFPVTVYNTSDAPMILSFSIHVKSEKMEAWKFSVQCDGKDGPVHVPANDAKHVKCSADHSLAYPFRDDEKVTTWLTIGDLVTAQNIVMKIPGMYPSD